MCTLIIRHRIDDWCSTLIAANRDEFYHRPSVGPRVLKAKPRIVGGRDELAGGTWLAFTSDGLFVGLTNQRSYGGRDDSLRSRGELVVDALSAGSFDGVTHFLKGVDGRSYNEFNLIYGDGDRACAGYGRLDRGEVELQALGPGVHVLCNDRLGSPEFPKADEARAKVESIEPGSWEEIQAQLIRVLSDRSLPDAG